MKARPATLEQIQRWMQSVITHPGGVAEGLSAPTTRAQLDVADDELESVIARSSALESGERLEIYVDAYHERLLECLREEFTATRCALGDELFEAVAFGYLQHHPSHSYTLALLGASFPRYLAESRLHERATPPEVKPTWGEFVIELAMFERTQRDVFDSPGSEGQASLRRDELATIPGDAWGDLRFTPVACLRLARFEHPVHAYWVAHKEIGSAEAAPPSAPLPRATYLAISRRHYAVQRHELEPAEFAILERLIAGNTLSQAIASVALLPGSELPRPESASWEAALGEWFARWTSAGFFSGLQS